MSAAHHFGPQLQMYVPAGAFEEARAEGALQFSTTANEGGSYEEIKARKIAAGKVSYATDTRSVAPEGEETFHDSVAAGGVHRPVTVDLQPDAVPRLKEGHHRVLTQAEINPAAEIPVDYSGKAPNAAGELRTYPDWRTLGQRR